MSLDVESKLIVHLSSQEKRKDWAINLDSTSRDMINAGQESKHAGTEAIFSMKR